MLIKHYRKSLPASAIALALMAVLLPSCADTTQDVVTAGQEEENVTAEEVEENTEQLIGQSVSIRGEVRDVLDNVTFTISEDEFFGGDEIIVVNTSGEPFMLPEDDDVEVQVTGEVRQFNMVEFEEEFDLDFQFDTDYEQQPAIVAESLALAPKPGEITEDPSQFYNQTVAVEGEVEEIMSNNTFTLDEDQLAGGGDLLVFTLVAPERTMVEGEDVVVTGEVRPFIAAEFERDYELTWDLDVKRQLEAEYENKPVFIAKSIYPSAQ
ncbi:hypothetical protein MC7420_1507 [Coleofasciculus chthonoplastes PCC 7420]|uniref:OB-fold nucleic acid binding domain protein n=1 Tax=Coleofasciculus chthonoplastes PCC 7420 TaxID=118168 RepID=B4VRU7_9CYAN|nr:hypothetical protein [Coleofasciculus chthonoplastes]EDX75589.1 hypothetical protein MC7420_1507 [Coleofasciculus chthonoplastes PCC 7420]